jgi:hypothetical protein
MTKRSTLPEIEPLAVKTREAQRLGSWGKTKLFNLIKNGELESFLDGGVRMITTASIRERIQRKLEKGGTTMKDVSLLTEASVEKRRRAKAAENEAMP